MLEKIKDKVLFLDTETTGREENDRIFQLAFVFNDEKYSGLCKPPVPISIEAMEATHYTNEDVKDKPEFANIPEAKILQDIIKKYDPIIVAHNAKFDIEMLKKEGIDIIKFIDTLKVAKHLDPEEKLGAYRLQYLRYALDLQVGKIPAHDALADVVVLIELFKRLFKKIKNTKKYSDEEVLNYMIELTKKPIEIKTITFGKHKGKTIKEIAQTDPDYLKWLYSEKIKEKQQGNIYDNLEDWLYTLEKYIK